MTRATNIKSPSVGQIRELLANGPMTAHDIGAQLGISRTGVRRFLRYMANDLREVRKTGEQADRRRDLWELGENPEVVDPQVEQQAQTVPARQVGMWRDSLVAALFGPAPGAAS